MTHPLRFGVWAPVHGSRAARHDPDEPNDASWARNRTLVLEAERLGYDSVLVAQHTVNPYDESRDQLEAWTASAALAALTSRIELIAAIKPGLYHPVVLAKMALQIEHVSGGRFASTSSTPGTAPNSSARACRSRPTTSATPTAASGSRWWTGFCVVSGSPSRVATSAWRITNSSRRHFSGATGRFMWAASRAGPRAGRRPRRSLVHQRPAARRGRRPHRRRGSPPGRSGAPALRPLGLRHRARRKPQAQAEFARLLDLSRRDEAIRADTRARTDAASVMFAKTDAAASHHVGTNGGTAAGVVGAATMGSRSASAPSTRPASSCSCCNSSRSRPRMARFANTSFRG